MNSSPGETQSFFLLCLGLFLLPDAFGATPVDYLREVKPILAQNCYRCHGASQQKSELRLDTAAAAQKGGRNGPSLKPNDSAQSLIVKLLRGTHQDIPRMPFKKPPLSDAQIALVQQWIDQGASAPADEEPEKTIHWSFVPPLGGPPPPVKQTAWPRNAIDHFVLARLEKEGIKPSAEADRATLLRRLTLDLIGLPPTPEEVAAFLQDRRPDAYEAVVERLLGSPHYGERWGRYWLDVARYADSNGYSIDAPRSIWKYRDWVINALNRDLPFNQFVIEQLAGDLFPDATVEQKIATGFNRNTQINQEGGIDPEQFRVESVMDRVNTTGTAFLGLTIGCAQCHDHKFDPITQREYYQLFAFFNNTVDDGHGQSAPGGLLEVPGEIEAADNLEKDLEEAEADLNRYLDTKGNEVVKWEQDLTPEARAKLKADIRKILPRPFADRTPPQKRAVYAAFLPEDPQFKQRDAKLRKLEKRQPKPVTTLVMAERPTARETHLLIQGDFTRPGARVTSGVPAVLPPLRPRPVADPAPNSDVSAATGAAQNATATPGAADANMTEAASRLDLAHWIVDARNPLSARVTVNRIWQQYFGRGLVETENDFGSQGSAPTHPELLDWLATELVAQQWSLKALHRLIVTSAAYRQSSRHRPELANVDPNNKLLARQSRFRLDAEIVRDVALSVSGLLTERLGGPSVFPPQPAGVMTLGQSKRDWTPSAGADRYRRGLYTFFWRATPHPTLTVFDSPDAFSTCTRRVRSNTPLQALTLLNDEAFYEFARHLARRVWAEEAKDEAARMDLAFRLCVARSPASDESQRLLDLLRQELAAFEKSPEEALAIVGEKSAGRTSATQLAAWTTVSRVLLNLDEMTTRE